MADSYLIIDGVVVPYSGGRKCNDTDAWRDATPLELQMQEQLAEHEHTIATQEDEIKALRELVEKLRADRDSWEQQASDRAADWHAEHLRAERLRAEVAAWRELSDHVRVGACAAIWPDRYTDARTRDVAAALKRAAWMAEAVETLRAEVEKVTCELMDAITRADKLTEALREWWSAHRPVGWTEDQHRARPYVNLITVADKALTDALLRDQEEGK